MRGSRQSLGEHICGSHDVNFGPFKSFWDGDYLKFHHDKIKIFYVQYTLCRMVPLSLSLSSLSLEVDQEINSCSSFIPMWLPLDLHVTLLISQLDHLSHLIVCLFIRILTIKSMLPLYQVDGWSSSCASWQVNGNSPHEKWLAGIDLFSWVMSLKWLWASSP